MRDSLVGDTDVLGGYMQSSQHLKRCFLALSICTLVIFIAAIFIICHHVRSDPLLYHISEPPVRLKKACLDNLTKFEQWK